MSFFKSEAIHTSKVWNLSSFYIDFYCLAVVYNAHEHR